LDKKATAARRSGRARTWFQAAWFALTNGYARGYTSGKIFTGGTKVLCVPGLNCYSCPGALFACPIGSLQAVLNSGAFKFSLYVFGLMSAFGVLLGRFVCGWMCPFGLVQDLLHKIPLGGKKKNLPGHKYLRYLRFVVLAVMVIALPALVKSDGGTGQPWFCEWICPSGTLSAGIPLVLLNAEFQEIIGFRFFWKVAVLVICVLVSIWYYRPFCKYLCPLGAFYGVFNPVSMYRLEVDANKCIRCGACQRACGMDIPTFQTPNSMDCIRCGDCVAACPTGAIESTLERIESQLKDRFIADEDVMTEPVTQSVEPTKATVIHDGEKLVVRAVGVLLIVGGLTSMAMSSIHGVFNDFDMHLTIEALSDAPYLYTGLNIMKVFASLMVFMTGVYLMRNADRAERVKTASEKLGWAYVAYLGGVAMFIVALVLNMSIISLAITDIINFFCLLCLPILWRLAAAIKRRLNGDEGHVRLVILLVLAVVSVVGYAGWSTYNVVHFFNVIMTM